MAGKISILVVEDDPIAVESWQRQIEFHNANETECPFELIAEYTDSADRARELIASRKYDAAVVDLRLKGQDGNAHNDDGNSIVELFASSEMAAIAIHTGASSETRRDAFPHVRVIDKAGGLGPVFEWLSEQSQIIFNMRGALNILQKDMAALFHRSIWPRWEYWSQESPDGAKLAPALARHMTSHMYAGMLRAAEAVHPEEHYFVPCLAVDGIMTGDLLRRPDNQVEIVVTPRCDIAHPEKASTIQLAECEDVSTEWDKLVAGADKGVKSDQTELQRWKQHRSKNVLHFLPPMRLNKGRQEGPWFIRFDRIRSVSKGSEEEKNLKALCFASVTSEFLPSIVQRLGVFFSRIGTPDIS